MRVGLGRSSRSPGSRHWSLFEMSSSDWEQEQVSDRLAALLGVLKGPHRNLAVLTKVLHLKRPALIPVLDSLIAHQVGWTLGVPAVAVIEHLRHEGTANLDAPTPSTRGMTTLAYRFALDLNDRQATACARARRAVRKAWASHIR